jgi:hypothetical protein
MCGSGSVQPTSTVPFNCDAHLVFIPSHLLCDSSIVRERTNSLEWLQVQTSRNSKSEILRELAA